MTFSEVCSTSMFRSMDKFKRVFSELFAKAENLKSVRQQYVHIKAALEEPLVAHDFESFLLPFQTKEPIIDLLYPSMCKLLSDLFSK